MTVNDAYSVLKKEHPLDQVTMCLDYGDFFVFSFAPLYFGDSMCATGTVFEAVNKSDGSVFMYNILEDLESFLNAERVMPTNTVLDSPIP